ncbi:MAG: guanylate kinase [Nitrospirota bacterium]|nr:MAG: guanylate kinase [Nitrospirota bacterium]
MKRGNLIVVSAPSGAGKTTLCRMLCDRIDGIEHSVSFTTRTPREGEQNDIDYSFIDVDEFREMINRNEFLEWAEVHGNYYGTSRIRIDEKRGSGADIIMDIDTQGARQLMEKLADATYIFVLPPSPEELESRLRGRGTESEEVISMRLRKAREEISDFDRYEYVIINDSLEQAVEELRCIVQARRYGISSIDHDRIKEIFLKEDV